MQRAKSGAVSPSVGLDAGEPPHDRGDLYGTPVIVASRLFDHAGGGEILASEVVCQIAGPCIAELIQPVGALKLRGVEGRVAAAQVRWREDPPGEPARSEPQAPPSEISVVIAEKQHFGRVARRGRRSRSRWGIAVRLPVGRHVRALFPRLACVSRVSSFT
jgi:hypothetical protein